MRHLEAVTGDRLAYHAGLEPRVYARIQAHRVAKSRRYLKRAINACQGKRPSIWEIGCAALDISGPFSDVAGVGGIECNGAYVTVAKARYPNAIMITGDAEMIAPDAFDILVACEILEHMVDPMATMSRLMPRCSYAVISHPINEPDGIPNTEHYWTFTYDDFKNWFTGNGFSLLKSEVFRNGCFDLAIGLGKKNAG